MKVGFEEFQTTKTLRIPIKDMTDCTKDIQFVMITYEDNKTFAEGTAKLLKDTWGHDCHIVMGYMIDGLKIKKNEVLMKGVEDVLLPKTIDMGKPIIYMEDDTIFTHNPLDFIRPDDEVVWLGYRKGKLTNKAPHNVITGSQAIFMDNHSQRVVLEHFKNRKRKIHIDGAFSEVFRQRNLSFRHEKNISYERDHISLISKKEDWVKYTKPH